MAKKHNISEETHQSTVAGQTLQEAMEQVGKKHKVHGDTVASFTMIAELWTVYVNHVSVVNTTVNLDPSDVAQMMAMLKIARSVYGTGKDNFVDGAGYIGLASMLDNLEE